MNAKSLVLGAAVLTVTLFAAPAASAQVAKGLVDPNVAGEKELLSLPHMTAPIVKALMQRRPFLSATDLQAFLISQKLTPQQATDFYGKAFVHVNLNTGTRDEILLIPGAGTRMAREFAEYRPWRTWGQFDKEISKYVGQPETARLRQYVLSPGSLNPARGADIRSIPGAGSRMVRGCKEYRPWTPTGQFERGPGKYGDAKEAARLWRYVVIE